MKVNNKNIYIKKIKYIASKLNILNRKTNNFLWLNEMMIINQILLEMKEIHSYLGTWSKVISL